MPTGADLYNYYLNQGLDSTHAAAITGNAFGESGYDPTAVGDGGSAYGLFQWHPDRQAAFQAATGTPIGNSTWQQQAQFALTEMANNPSFAGDFWKQNTIEGATTAFTKYFERPADLLASASKRIGAALDVAGKATGSGSLSSIEDKLKNAGHDIASYFGVSGVTDGLGITGSCDWLCQLKNWITSSKIFSRTAFFVIGAILIIGAIVFFASQSNSVKSVAKGALTA